VNYKVAAYVTAYEDPESLSKCIHAINAQSYPVQKIFIVDNSSRHPTDFVKSVAENIILESHPENIGISGGLELGVRWAIDQDYDFLWTFDQDSEPEPETLEKLLASYENLQSKGLSIGIIAPLPIDPDSGLELHGSVFSQYKFELISEYKRDESFYECDIVITSGSLVFLDAAKFVELPDRNLFIDSVDWVYCMNFREKGYSIVLVKDITMKHHFGKPFSIRERNLISYSPLRYYYSCRNHSFVEIRYSKGINIPKAIVHRLKVLVNNLIEISLYESGLNLPKAQACILGTFHGFSGRLDKTWEQSL
jgi:rhamnosyltransferase